MSKTKDQLLNVRVNPATEAVPNDEVFITSDTSKVDKDGNPVDPYVNRGIFAKPGLFKDGQMSAEAVAKLEGRSDKELREDHEAKVAQEAKEREDTARAVAAKAAEKKEG